jgi:hypothetical protein
VESRRDEVEARMNVLETEIISNMSTTNGSHQSRYSVPHQAQLVFEEGILNNPLIAKDLPKDAKELGNKIRFDGSEAPSVPINWRFAESVSALKGLEAVMILSLIRKKYQTEVQEVAINTCVIYSNTLNKS